MQPVFETTTPKKYARGTHRSRAPEETLALLEPHLSGFGITRVANVTGLDRIGIPVFMVVRPNGRGLAVSQGKGIEPASAKVSGIMESIECHHAEYTASSVRLESYERLRDEVPTVDPESLPRSRSSRLSPKTMLAWTEAFDLVSREPVWVPFEMVHANFNYPAVPGGTCFLSTTNGLASGNTFVEAALHGTCEVIERDALAIWEKRSAATHDANRIDLATVDDAACRELLQRYDRAGIHVTAWNVTSDVGLPVFRAAIFDVTADAVFNPLSAALGSGCHPSRAVALSRALTEAAQSRLTAISGSRDDQTRAMYRGAQSAEALEEFRQMAAEPRGVVDFRSVPTREGETLEDDLSHVSRCLARVGAGRILAVDLSRRTMPISVVRILVPGLEGPIDSKLYVPGPRARAARSS